MLKFPMLPDGLAKDINKQLNRNDSKSDAYGLKHELLRYGEDGVAHAILMRCAMEQLNTQKKVRSLSEFVRRYRLIFPKGTQGFPPRGGDPFTGNKNAIIPGRRKLPTENLIRYFDYDYGNHLYGKWNNFTTDEKFMFEMMMSSPWRPRQLRNPEIANNGFRFGLSLWKSAFEGFRNVEDRMSNKMKKVSNDLASHYQQIIDLLMKK
ncbi:MAG: hypothetical protein PHZ00_06210 [Candidatus Peribacteraceae bacterium]|nr:hypothetical protein [Candidatus Peribacteraceae bacterium]